MQGGPSDKVNVRTCLDHMDGGFIEWLGSFWYMEDFSKVSNNGTSAKWNATLMQSGFPPGRNRYGGPGGFELPGRLCTTSIGLIIEYSQCFPNP